MKLVPDSKQKFITPRNVLYALQKVIDEIEGLVKEETLESLDHSPYPSRIVSVLKEDGSVKICADYKLATNP